MTISEESEGIHELCNAARNMLDLELRAVEVLRYAVMFKSEYGGSSDFPSEYVRRHPPSPLPRPRSPLAPECVTALASSRVERLLPAEALASTCRDLVLGGIHLPEALYPNLYRIRGLMFAYADEGGARIFRSPLVTPRPPHCAPAPQPPQRICRIVVYSKRGSWRCAVVGSPGGIPQGDVTALVEGVPGAPTPATVAIVQASWSSPLGVALSDCIEGEGTPAVLGGQRQVLFIHAVRDVYPVTSEAA